MEAQQITNECRDIIAAVNALTGTQFSHPLFWKASATNEGGKPVSSIWPQIGGHDNIPCAIGKRKRISKRQLFGMLWSPFSSSLPCWRSDSRLVL